MILIESGTIKSDTYGLYITSKEKNMECETEELLEDNGNAKS